MDTFAAMINFCLWKETYSISIVHLIGASKNIQLYVQVRFYMNYTNWNQLGSTKKMNFAKLVNIKVCFLLALASELYRKIKEAGVYELLYAIELRAQTRLIEYTYCCVCDDVCQKDANAIKGPMHILFIYIYKVEYSQLLYATAEDAHLLA